ncbi:MAG: hypothetical protein M5U09_08430 [Gammaproteobacteria bacterium]|nr:hypothetical protein [Gammaproteobacteria bacterium]
MLELEDPAAVQRILTWFDHLLEAQNRRVEELVARIGRMRGLGAELDAERERLDALRADFDERVAAPGRGARESAYGDRAHRRTRGRQPRAHGGRRRRTRAPRTAPWRASRPSTALPPPPGARRRPTPTRRCAAWSI